MNQPTKPAATAAKPKPPKAKPKNVYAFVDSQNLNLGTQLAGWKMDWRKFLAWLRQEHGVTEAFLFIGHKVEHEAMYEQLHSLGYRVVLKPTVETATLANPETYRDRDQAAGKVEKGR